MIEALVELSSFKEVEEVQDTREAEVRERKSGCEPSTPKFARGKSQTDGGRSAGLHRRVRKVDCEVEQQSQPRKAFEKLHEKARFR